jgi:hypothetical protein
MVGRSALFTLYNSVLASNPPPTEEPRAHLLRSMDTISTRISQFSASLFTDLDVVHILALSPFTAYSQYQAAVVQFRL